jgi:hypothetical protein
VLLLLLLRVGMSRQYDVRCCTVLRVALGKAWRVVGDTIMTLSGRCDNAHECVHRGGGAFDVAHHEGERGGDDR